MALTLLTADAPGITAFGTPQWGIFKSDGTPILTTDSVASIDYVRDYHVSDYPQEKGAFQSYNKVQVPYQAKIAFYIGLTRTKFLNDVEAVVSLLDFVTVVTPEVSYNKANLTHYGYRREARSGVTMIRVEVWCQQIRLAGDSILSGNELADKKTSSGTSSGDIKVKFGSESTQSNNAVSPVEGGQVQPTYVDDSDFSIPEIPYQDAPT